MYYYLLRFCGLNGLRRMGIAWAWGWGWGHLKALVIWMSKMAPTWLTVVATVGWELSWGCQPEQLYMCDFSIWLYFSKYGSCVPIVEIPRSKKSEIEAAGLLRPRTCHSVPCAIFFCQSSYRAHPSSKGGAIEPSYQWKQCQ